MVRFPFVCMLAFSVGSSLPSTQIAQTSPSMLPLSCKFRLDSTAYSMNGGADFPDAEELWSSVESLREYGGARLTETSGAGSGPGVCSKLSVKGAGALVGWGAPVPVSRTLAARSSASSMYVPRYWSAIACSLPAQRVTELTARLPSALAAIHRWQIRETRGLRQQLSAPTAWDTTSVRTVWRWTASMAGSRGGPAWPAPMGSVSTSTSIP